MTERRIRKCTSRNKNQRRWGVEFPLGWVEDLEMKGKMLELEKTDNEIIIKKVIATPLENKKDSEKTSKKEPPYDFGDSEF